MTSHENLAGALLVLGLIMYAVFGGADFGGGIWTLLASGPRRRLQRVMLFNAIGPVWETNHVWLIYVVVLLFTAFPKGFAALFIALLSPLVIALVGITFRGAAFAFRHFGGEGADGVPLLARTFEISSIVTPFALGIAVTAAAGGNIYPPHPWSWLSIFTLGGGMVGVAICAYLTPIYMSVRTREDLQEDFRRRGMLAGLILGLITTLEIPVAFLHAPIFADRLSSGFAILFVALAVTFGVLTELALLARWFLTAQIMSAATVAWMLIAFGAALYPDLVVGELSLKAAVAPKETLQALLTVLPLGALILVPSLIFLYWTFRGEPDPDLPPYHGP